MKAKGVICLQPWRLHLQPDSKQNFKKTHSKLLGNAIGCFLVRRLLSLQLGQAAPQYPGLMLHGWLYSTLPGIGHLSQACQDTKVLVHRSWIRVAKAWVRGGGTAAQNTSLLQLSHQGTTVRERMNCLRGSKSKRTGSVVRLKTLPRPLGVSHWVLKSPGCLIVWQCCRGEWQGNTHKDSRPHIYAHDQPLTAAPTQSQSTMQEVEPVGRHSAPTGGVKEGCGEGWRQRQKGWRRESLRILKILMF